MFIIIYAGISDFLDGYLARKYSVQSYFGGIIDSIADLIFFFSIICTLIIFEIDMIYRNIEILLFVITLRILAMIICKIKYGKIYSIHTVSSKITGVSIFFGLIAYILVKNENIILILVSISLVSAIEEVLIFIFINNPDINKKSIFSK